ncbi:MAG: hypothetical protein M1499_07335 [Firmicutes bacterium]|jgi:hypothetical protein|nr:hypothetical protein [Bacillota bacterium]
MKRYMNGMMTGALVGAVMAGIWLLNRPRPSWAQVAIRGARRMGPRAWKVARTGSKGLVHMARRRLS